MAVSRFTQESPGNRNLSPESSPPQENVPLSYPANSSAKRSAKIAFTGRFRSHPFAGNFL